MIRAKEKKERALGMKLFLKGERCNSPKCAMVRRPFRPGVHGKKRTKAKSEYGSQLLEKQRIKVSYGLGERQLETIFKKAMKKTGVTGEIIISSLERQLSNAVFRLGLASSRIVARQLVGHGHILVNGKKTTIPSFLVKDGDVISIKPSSQNLLIFKNLADTIKKHEAPEWLLLNAEKMEGKVKGLPRNTEVPFDINLVVDFYSK
jgi:small subunit ribosomal protein S4